MRPIHATIAAAFLTFFAVVTIRRTPLLAAPRGASLPAAVVDLPPVHIAAAQLGAVAPPHNPAAALSGPAGLAGTMAVYAPALSAHAGLTPRAPAWHGLLAAQSLRSSSQQGGLCVDEFFATEAAATAKCPKPACRVMTGLKDYTEKGFLCVHEISDSCKAATSAPNEPVCCIITGAYSRTVFNFDRCLECIQGFPLMHRACHKDLAPSTPSPTPSPSPSPKADPLARCNGYPRCGYAGYRPSCCASHKGRMIVGNSCTCRSCWGGWPMHMAFCTRYHKFRYPFNCDTCKPGTPVCCVTILGYRTLESSCKCECNGGMVKSAGKCAVEGSAIPDLRNTW